MWTTDWTKDRGFEPRIHPNIQRGGTNLPNANADSYQIQGFQWLVPNLNHHRFHRLPVVKLDSPQVQGQEAQCNLHPVCMLDSPPVQGQVTEFNHHPVTHRTVTNINHWCRLVMIVNTLIVMNVVMMMMVMPQLSPISQCSRWINCSMKLIGCDAGQSLKVLHVLLFLLFYCFLENVIHTWSFTFIHCCRCVHTGHFTYDFNWVQLQILWYFLLLVTINIFNIFQHPRYPRNKRKMAGRAACTKIRWFSDGSV